MAVTPDEIAVELGRTAPASGSPEFKQWSNWIEDALLLIEARLGDPTLLDQRNLDYVVRHAVAAHVRHPEDVRRVDVSVDDGRVGKEYRSGKGRVTILDEWWDLLGTDSKGGAFSIIPTGGYVNHVPWCALMLGALYCSCGADIAGEPIYELGGY